jgi:cytochrome oxidase Cu insertion factor (SCO1/SenC/PrrC family)
MNLKNPRLVLLAIFLLFFGPVLLAVLMRSAWWDFTPAVRSNLGTLVQPPQASAIEDVAMIHPVEANPDQGRWTILYPFPGECDHACRDTVSMLRQVHVSTGRHRERVSVMLLAPADVAAATVSEFIDIYPEFLIAKDAHGAIAGALATVSVLPGDFGDGRTFLLDPAGNIILAYASGFDPNHVKQDLKRLLTWSAQDEPQ